MVEYETVATAWGTQKVKYVLASLVGMATCMSYFIFPDKYLHLGLIVCSVAAILDALWDDNSGEGYAPQVLRFLVFMGNLLAVLTMAYLL